MDQDVAAYYNQTQNHYQRWWHLDKSMALHYGLWYDNTRNFREALNNTNKYLASLADVQTGQRILDAGCGVGGSAIFLAQQYDAKVTGISLSDLQIKTAKTNGIKHQVEELVDFKLQDYARTEFEDHSFDLIWACESSSSAANKQAMIKEWYRLLKPGGKIVLTDFFRTQEENNNEGFLLDKWSEAWAMSSLITSTSLCNQLKNCGFHIHQVNNLTNFIKPTVNRMYASYWLGLLPSVIYNFIIGARPYARTHYKSGLYQYKSLQKKWWQYESILAVKPI